MYEYSHCPGRGRTEESWIKGVGKQELYIAQLHNITKEGERKMSELKLVTGTIRINGIRNKASDMPEEEVKRLIRQKTDELLISMNYERKAAG